MDWLLSLSQVFGGCCSNVFLFETLLREAKKSPNSPDIGLLVTFCQFVLVAIISLAPLIDRQNSKWHTLYLKKTNIPLRKLIQSVVMFFVMSVLNNSVWEFGISVPIHIMFRSSGTVITMVVGYLFGGKRYSKGQVCSSILVTVGAILVISQREKVDLEWLFQQVDTRFCFGILLLFSASVLGAFMGLYTESIYEKYGNHWQETLFYTHLLGIPLFGIRRNSIFRDIKSIWSAAPTVVISKYPYIEILQLFAFLLLNCISQVVCARGVNQLCGIASSLTVTMVLLVRKFVSLVLSAYFFGNRFNTQGYVGATILVIGTIQYSLSTVYRSKVKTD